MRDYLLALTIALSLPVIMRHPFAGILVWIWLSVNAPSHQTYGFARPLAFNAIVAVVTMFSWMISREKKSWPNDSISFALACLTGWMTINMAMAVDPSWSWPYWSLTAKTMVLIFMVMVMATSKARLHAVVWMVVISVGYYGVKGSIFTILTGGGSIVYGPENTMIGDNNHLALATVMILPLIHYLRIETSNKWIRHGLGLVFFIQFFSILGSYSRGGAIALGVMLLMFWRESQHKILYMVLGLAALGVVLTFMPDTFWSRMNTLRDTSTDASFQGRVSAWWVAFYFAIDHFPFGAGFYAPQLESVFNAYFPTEAAHAAHSIYFQVLGEQGVIGLLVYLVMCVSGLLGCRDVIRRARTVSGLDWIIVLAKMIRVSLIAFFVGGAALSLAYYDAYLLLYSLIVALRTMARKAQREQAAAMPKGIAASV